jgi:hypothetical protein
VLSKNRSHVYASLEWLKEMHAIDDADIAAFERVKKLRNELAHELTGILFQGLPADLAELLSEMISLLDKIERWWIVNVEIPINPDLNGMEINESQVIPGPLHPLLEQLGIEKQGFHGFRRFRVTHLESSTVPPALVKYWTGHASSSDGEAVRSTVTDRYVKMAKDTKFRSEVAERIGVGFELPKAETVEVVPSVPNSQEMEVVVSV